MIQPADLWPHFTDFESAIRKYRDRLTRFGRHLFRHILIPDT